MAKYDVQVTRIVTVDAHNLATAFYLAQEAVDKGLPIEGVVQIAKELPKIVKEEK
jgi:hypothetical protein